MSQFGKLLMFGGLLIAALGAFLWLGPKVPWLNKLGKLPGDLQFQGKGYKIYFPWVTCLLLSLILTLISYFFRGFKK